MANISFNFDAVEPTVRISENLDWATLLLLGCFLCYAFAKYLYPRRFQEFVALPITNKYFLVLGKGNELNNPFNILLFVAQVLSISFFIFMWFDVADIPIETRPLLLYVQICTGYTVFILSKLVIEKMTGNIFNLETAIDKYLYQKLSYRNFLAIVVFAVNLLFLYVLKPTMILLTLCGGTLILLNVITLIYSYRTNQSIIFSHLFYFILYLCALEISPYIILYKVLV